MSGVLAFWLVYVPTRPLGAALGDLLTQAPPEGGIGLGAKVTSAVFLTVIIVLVALAQRKDAPHQALLLTQLLRRAHDDTGRAEAMDERQAGIERSQRLIGPLRQVARAEPDVVTPLCEPVDVAELGRSVVARLSIQADQQQLDLGAVAEDGVTVEGAPHQLVVLLDNLVENALPYTPTRGSVDVRAGLLDGVPTLRVIDTGPGIAVAEREQVFRRFYRGRDAARTARQVGGSGLGLSIVRAIAELHGAVVSLHEGRGVHLGGLEVRLAFAA